MPHCPAPLSVTMQEGLAASLVVFLVDWFLCLGGWLSMRCCIGGAFQIATAWIQHQVE